jgi:DNA-directed RNA polymerase-5 subunit 1
MSCQKINLSGPYVVELSSEVVKRITFEEQVTDINVKRLQEVVDK